MAKYNAMIESFEEIEVFDKPALFTPARIDRSTVPSGYYLYEVRHDDDCQGDAVQIASNIMVNHWGSIILREEITLPQDGYLDIEPDCINYGVDVDVSMSDFITKYPLHGER